MQFLRRLPCQRFFSTQPVKTKIPRYTKQAEEIMSDTMIPGPYLRYFKTKKEKKKHDDQVRTDQQNE
jgi:hypothetical protein